MDRGIVTKALQELIRALQTSQCFIPHGCIQRGRVTLALAAVLCLTAVPSASANDLPRPGAFVCGFGEAATTIHDKNGFKTDVGEASMSFTVAGIDYDAGKAQLVGNAGTAPLIVMNGSGKATFIEITSAGVVHSLTIFSIPGPLKGYVSVYSRHSAFLDDIIVSQNYGYCEPRF